MDIVLTGLACLIFNCASGEVVTLDELAQDLARRDVVFLGEEHDNDQGHQMELEILKALHERRQDVVLSMEMFERDVQGVLDDYLRGRIGEETFLKHSRPWGNYAKHYRPLVEYAREHGLDVVAANAPRRAARGLATGGEAPRAFVARTTTAPDDRYWKAFQEAMREHPGTIDAGIMKQMYGAQCLKDDTMAESIADYLQGRPYRRPLVVHVCGSFHCDHGLGTVVRLLQRRPLCQVGVVSMKAVEDVKTAVLADDDREKAHYLLAVPEQPKEQKEPPVAVKEPPSAVPAEAQEEALTEEPLIEEPLTEEPLVEPAPLKEHAVAEPEPVKDVPVEPVDEPDDTGRAALGIMPDYGGSKDPGVVISAVSPGGGADRAGLKDGDRVTAIGKKPVRDLEEYMDVLAGFRPGQKVDVKVVRGTEEKTFQVTLGESHR